MHRRDFLTSAGALGAMAAVDGPFSRQAPAILRQRAARPVVVASSNGFWFRNGGPKTCIELAWERIVQGSDVLDALIAGVNIDELDPEEPYVGYGGLPNADGVVQLDASVMHGPRKRAGGVAALEGVRTPSLVARAVMDLTDNHLLVGQGAQLFARNAGFTVEPDLNTEYSRRQWLEWKRRTDAANFPDPARRPPGAAPEPFALTLHMHGTIHCSGVNAAGEICGVTSTSGRAFKIPGRVGDSPILGAGLYVDGEVGAAGSTGRGEANLFSLASFLIVEGMRAGRSPKDAGLAALQRIRANTVEKRLQKPNGDPNFNILFYILNARGEHAGVAMYGEDEGERGWAGQTATQFVRYSVCDENGPRMVNVEGLLPGTASK
ncbi:MAG TPA: N(4)-(beta-N-acetylglucosaminyl)-L-asparaginase [Gemmatimonadaceae bacterium]